MLAELVAIALVAAVVSRTEWSPSWWRSIAAVVAELAAELGAAPLDLDVLAELVAIALVAAVVSRTWWSPSWSRSIAAVVAELATGSTRHAGQAEVEE